MSTVSLSASSNRWYRWMLQRLCASESVPLSDSADRSFCRRDMLRLLERVSPPQVRVLPLTLQENRVTTFAEVVNCLTTRGSGPGCTEDDHLQVCRIGKHWGVLLVLRTGPGVRCVHVYHPGQVNATKRYRSSDGGEEVVVRMFGARYQTDDDADECAPFAIWGSLYVQQFLSEHGEPPCHIPWFAGEDRYGVRQVLGACEEYLASR